MESSSTDLDDAVVEEDLAPHKSAILEKVTQLNRSSLKSLLTTLEEKTKVFSQDEDTKIGDLLKVLRHEIKKLLDKWTP